MQRIVVKLGTNVIMRPDGKVALGLLCGLVEQIAALRAQGLEVLVVSSGAVGLGAGLRCGGAVAVDGAV
jgi:glutamate 5-kinase